MLLSVSVLLPKHYSSCDIAVEMLKAKFNPSGNSSPILDQCSFALKGNLAAFGDIFGCHNWGREILSLASHEGAKDSGKHPKIHKAVTYNKELPVQTINLAIDEKLQPGFIGFNSPF